MVRQMTTLFFCPSKREDNCAPKKNQILSAQSPGANDIGEFSHANGIRAGRMGRKARVMEETFHGLYVDHVYALAAPPIL
jgi:hypothetical protein